MSALTPIAAALASAHAREVAERQAKCEHHGLYWYLATNENGWRCVDCDMRPGEPPGYSPQHDVSHLDVKVMSILQDISGALTIGDGIVYLSNNDHADGIAGLVTRQMREAGTFDQYSIALGILTALTPSHANYWRRVGDGVRAGCDPRDRCPCGALSTSTRCGTPPRHRCSRHWTLDEETDDEFRARLGLAVKP